MLSRYGLLDLRAISGKRSYYLIVLIAVGLLTAFFVSRFPALRFDYDFEAFFPNEDHELELYQDYRQTFGYDNEFVLIAVENKDGIFRLNFLQRIDSFGRDLAKVPQVKQVQSPTNLKRVNFDGLLPVSFPLLHFNDTSQYRRDSIYVYNDQMLRGSFFPEDALSLSIFVKTGTNLTKRESDDLADEINNVIRKYRFDDVHVAGRIFAQKVYLHNLQSEFVLFISISFLLVLLFLKIIFRRTNAVILPVIVVVVSVLWTLGIMALTGKPIDLLTTMLPTMVFIAGMSDVVHFYSKYIDLRASGVASTPTFRLVAKEVGFPTFLTLLTTAVAFLSLLFSSIRPVREFGIYTSVGISIAFILSYTLLPALLFFTDPPVRPVADRGNSDSAYLRKLMAWVLRNQKTILVSTVLLLVISGLGISKIRINNILLEDLDDRVRIKRDFVYFDKHYSGARPFELDVKVLRKKSSILDHDLLMQIHRVDSFVRAQYGAGFLVSPALVAIEYYRNRTGDTISIFPPIQDFADVRDFLEKNRRNKALRRLMTTDGQRARISGKIRDIGSSKVTELNHQLHHFISQNTDTTALHFSLTGAAHLIDRNNDYMVDNMLKGFGASVFIISLLTFLLHRSWRMVLVFILPNVVPLLAIAGLMGFAGIELKAATSIIFSIAFGIATDDTIHFISRLKLEKDYGKSLLYAFKRTYLETGRPIVLTTLILIGGFMSLMASSFQSTFYFGLLTCISMLIAVLADLILLPVLLMTLYRKKK